MKRAAGFFGSSLNPNPNRNLPTRIEIELTITIGIKGEHWFSRLVLGGFLGEFDGASALLLKRAVTMAFMHSVKHFHASPRLARRNA